MSVWWETNHFGYDGDDFVGRIRVNCWQPRAQVLAALESQFEEIRRGVIQHHDRLVGVERTTADPAGR